MRRFRRGDPVLINCPDDRCKEKEGIVDYLEESSGFPGYRLKSGSWIYEEWATLNEKNMSDKVSPALDSKYLTGEKNYAPHCLNCETMGRLSRTEDGFICKGEGDHWNRAGCGQVHRMTQEFLDKYEEVHGEKWLPTRRTHEK